MESYHTVCFEAVHRCKYTGIALDYSGGLHYSGLQPIKKRAAVVKSAALKRF